MDRAVTFLIIVAGFPSTTANHPNKTLFHTTNQKLNYEEATALCEGFGEEWSLPNYKTFQEELHIYMKTQNVKSAWLGVKKKVLPTWTWVNGVSDSTVMVKNGASEPHANLPCAALDVSIQNLTPISCGHQGIGFVCQMPEGKGCREEFHRQSCFRKADTWYTVGCNSKNWYHARSYCLDKGGDLAVLDTPKKRKDIINAIITRRLAGECAWVYVGLKKEQWLFARPFNDTESTNSTNLGEVKVMNWTTDEPRPKHVCVKLSVENHDRGWITDDCFNPNHVICQNFGQGILEKISPTKQSARYIIYQQANIQWVVVIAVCVVAAVIILSFIIGLIVYKLSKRKQQSSSEETYPLLPLSERNPFKGITVVIFSEGINKKQKELKGVKIVGKHIWKYQLQGQNGTRIASRISSGFKKVMDKETESGNKNNNIDKGKFEAAKNEKGESEADKDDKGKFEAAKNEKGESEVDKDDKGKSEAGKDALRNDVADSGTDGKGMTREAKATLRVINMPPLAGRKLPENLMKDLETADFPNTILFIPEISAPASKDTLNSLFNLRKKHVCITAAKRESNEVPAAECIAVGVEHYTDEMITSGVLDFILDASECKGCTSLDDGVATVVGMVAGFMQQLVITFTDKSNKWKGKLAGISRTKLIRHLLIKLISKNLEDHTLSGYGHLTRQKMLVENQKEDIEQIITKMVEEESVQSISNKQDEATSADIKPIKIILAATPINQEKISQKFPKSSGELDISYYEKKESDIEEPSKDEINDAIEKFTEELCKHDIKYKKGEDNKIKLYEAPVYPEKYLMDWYGWRQILEEKLTGNGENPHIIFLAAIKRNPPAGMRIQHTIRTLKRKCIVITNALGFRGPGGPTAFPSDSVIAVTDKTHGACGSTVDFVMESEDSWGSAMRAVAFTAAVLVKAQRFGYKDERFRRLCTTNVMHRILREMCERPEKHNQDDGFGKLDPNILKDDAKMKKILHKYVDEKIVTDIWSGKTI